VSKICWASDLHFDIAADYRLRRAFYDEVVSARPDWLVVSGDVSSGREIEEHLCELHDSVPCPELFVLGNHDFYGRSIAEVRESVRALSPRLPHLTWLTDVGVLPASAYVCIIGHDGWADGRLGEYARSTVVLNDYLCIRDFIPLEKWDRLSLMQQLADEAAQHMHRWLPEACARYRRIFVVTHTPPFAEACRHHGEPSDPLWLPHFSCKTLGSVLRKAAEAHSECAFEVLCGHTHEAVDANILPNLRVRTAFAQYGRPGVAAMIEV
jgi:predicted phosphohydrolase